MIWASDMQTIMIGNSDNKLSQYDWATFVKALRNLCVELHKMHRAGIILFDEKTLTYRLTLKATLKAAQIKEERERHVGQQASNA